MYNSGLLIGLHFLMPHSSTKFGDHEWACKSATFTVKDKSGIEHQVCEAGQNSVSWKTNLDIYPSCLTKALNIDIKTADSYRAGTDGQIKAQINYADGTHSAWTDLQYGNDDFYRGALTHREIMAEMQNGDYKPIKSVTFKLTRGDSSWKCEYIQFEGHAKVDVNKKLHAGKSDDSVTIDFI